LEEKISASTSYFNFYLLLSHVLQLPPHHCIKSASSHIREDTAETDHSILSNEDGITQGKYQHTQGKNQLDIAAHLAVISAAQGKQNAQHGNNQMPAIQHMPYSSIHNRKDLL